MEGKNLHIYHETVVSFASLLSVRTLKLVDKFDYTDLPKVDQLIADFYVLDDSARADLFDYLKFMKNKHSDTNRKKILRKL